MTVDRCSHRGGPHLSRFGLTSHGGHKIFPHIVPTVKRKKDEEEKEKERRVKKGRRMIDDRERKEESAVLTPRTALGLLLCSRMVWVSLSGSAP